MANLLPQEQKEKQRTERWMRVATIGVLGAGLVFVAGAITFIPSFVYTQFRLSDVHAQEVVLEQSLEVYENETTNAILNAISERIELLKKKKEERSVLVYIKEIAQVRGNEIHIEQITYSGTKNDIQISGSAESRSALIAFSENLEQSPLFESAIVPVSSLVKDENITFNFNVVLYESEE